MKEMVYTERHSPIVLDRGLYNDYEYLIISFGTHPCAYVRVPKTHPYYYRGYDYCDIVCHGGLTYSNNSVIIDDGMLGRDWWLGWDYAHCNDFRGDMPKEMFVFDYKKYTTEEMKQDCIDVIEQLIEIEKQNT